jgi:uncharacterized protein (DUF4415 family)
MKPISTTETVNDLDEYPEITQADFDRAGYRVAGQAVDKKVWQEAVSSGQKKQKISITLDPDVLAYFRASAGERGYQTLINKTLREAMQQQSFTETLRQVIREELKPH